MARNLLKRFALNEPYIAAGFAFWALLIIRFGYTFGTGDAAEFLPYALKISDPSLYSTDLFIQKLWENPVNERIVFCTLLSFFSGNIEIVCLAGHIIFSVLLIWGIIKIAEAFLGRTIYAFLVPQILLQAFTLHFPGGADMWMNNFQPDLIAYTCGVWGIYFMLKDEKFKPVFLFITATFFHPLIGLFAAVPAFGGTFLHILTSGKMLRFKAWVLPVLLYVFTAGVYILLLKQEPPKTISNEVYFQIFFELRYPHHTLPTHFQKLSIAALIILAITGLIFFHKNEKKLFWFLLVQCVIFIFYAVSVQVFHWVEVGLTQWFRSGTFTICFGLIALAAMLQSKIRHFTFKIHRFFKAGASIFGIVTLLVLLLAPNYFPFNKPYETGKHKLENPEILFSKKIAETGLHGTFLLPFNFNAHKFYARQSSYVDYKTIPRENAAIAEWYRRANIVYGLDTASGLKGFEAQENAKKFYSRIDDKKLEIFKSEKIDFIVAESVLQHNKLSFIFSSGGYFLYKLLP